MSDEWAGPVGALVGLVIGVLFIWHHRPREKPMDPWDHSPEVRQWILRQERKVYMTLQEQRAMERECGIEPSDLASVRSTWDYQDPPHNVSTAGSMRPVTQEADRYITHWGAHSEKWYLAPAHCINCEDLLEIVTPTSRRFDCGCGKCSVAKPTPVSLQKRRRCSDPDIIEVTNWDGTVLHRIEQCGCGLCETEQRVLGTGTPRNPYVIVERSTEWRKNERRDWV